ncbi:glycosyltransferase family 39 protein [Nitrosophilus kaiyonis]|uniref:glycosyltransferase family 39 protein n=1 Tax=Nitrosophilus kaiyonis TaxID=2930200 RepID=UPI00249394E2|nr:glycosyltransferase family 39 protein [Nitrosophilus kaiyonis]
MKPKKILYIYLFFYSIFLILISKTIYISPKEALIFYEEKSLLHFITNFTVSLFGKNEIGLRIFFIVVNVTNILLLYDISTKILKKENDALLTAFIFSILPGFLSSSLLINEAPLIIFFTLLFLYFYIKFKKIAYTLFPIMLFIDNSFAIFFLSLFFYSLFKKDNLTIIISLIFFTLSMYIFGFDVSGKPKNYFLDTFAIYSAIFSPLIFIYFFYSVYRILIKEKKDIIWFISFVSFLFSLLLSFRQKISVEDFAPFVLIGTPLMIKQFLSSYRVRIPIFRKKHKILFSIVLISVLINDFLLIDNKILYYWIDNPKKHFAYNFHISKQLANSLKKMGITCIKTYDKKLSLQLKFYDICNHSNFILTDRKLYRNSKKVSIRYKKIVLKNYYVSKINNKESF